MLSKIRQLIMSLLSDRSLCYKQSLVVGVCAFRSPPVDCGVSLWTRLCSCVYLTQISGFLIGTEWQSVGFPLIDAGRMFWCSM